MTLGSRATGLEPRDGRQSALDSDTRLQRVFGRIHGTPGGVAMHNTAWQVATQGPI